MEHYIKQMSQPRPMLALFVYGSLADAALFEQITTIPPIYRKAVLNGYIRVQVQNSDFPAIIADSAKRVDGLLTQPLDEPTLALLDEYEGDEYERIRVSVTVVEANGSVEAWTYVLAPLHQNRAMVI